MGDDHRKPHELFWNLCCGFQRFQRRSCVQAKAVKGCKAMLIVSSPTYGMTKWTFRELQMADNNAKKLIPIYHSGNFPPNDKVEVFLGGTQYIDFSSGHERTFDVSPAMVCPSHLATRSPDADRCCRQEKVTELVAKLKKNKIFPDKVAIASGQGGASPPSGGRRPRKLAQVYSQEEIEVAPLAESLRE